MERRPPEGVDVVSAAASASVIWRDAGRAVNGAGTSPVRAAIHDADVRQAGAALARAEAGQARALEQLELREALDPTRPRGRRRSCPCRGRRRPSVGGGGSGASSAAAPTDAERHLAGHPGEQVARRAAQVDDDGVARRRRLVAGRVVGRHDGADPAGLVALEPDELPRDRRHGTPAGGVPTATAAPSVDAGGVQPLGRARREQAVEVVARARPAGSRRRPVATTISSAWTWSIPVGVRATTVGPG